MRSNYLSELTWEELIDLHKAESKKLGARRSDPRLEDINAEITKRLKEMDPTTNSKEEQI